MEKTRAGEKKAHKRRSLDQILVCGDNNVSRLYSRLVLFKCDTAANVSYNICHTLFKKIKS